MKIILGFAVACVGLVLVFAVFGLLEPQSQNIQAFPAALHIPKQQTPQELTLLFAGDIMLDRGVEWKVNQNPPAGGGGDWRWPFLKIADTLQKADLVFGNLESQISDKGINVGSIYSFRANPQSLEGLTYAGFDVVSVANNHSLDYTREAFEDSLNRLWQSGIVPVADVLAIKEVKDVKIGFLAYTNFPGIAEVNWDNLQEVVQDIRYAKSRVDILVVSVHAGEEYDKGPNEFQKVFAQSAIDAGADFLIGHHPHVIQPLVPHVRDAELGWIAYSLGNFVFDQSFSEETMQGAILKVVLEDTNIKEVSFLPTKINSSYQVELAE